MTTDEIHLFAKNLMEEVWEPFDSTKLADFYHPDVVGHHRSQTIGYKDLENRIAWDRKNRQSQKFQITDVIAEKDRFSIRFVFTTLELQTMQNSEIEVIYFYHLRDNKISEFWLLASIDFDYKQPA
jgi:predicted ester cyclase